jgi:hypothetical protein
MTIFTSAVQKILGRELDDDILGMLAANHDSAFTKPWKTNL